MANRNVLVVDDERDMRIYLSTIVETLGGVPIVACDDAEAIQVAASDLPALIILDIMMPKIENGIRAYQRFKTDPQFSGIPIIVLSAIAHKTFLHTIRILGPQIRHLLPEPEAYVEKPPDADELSGLIRKFVAF
jgi:CheY-like chemotaxis protein